MHVTFLIPVFISPRPLRPPNGLGGQIWPQIWNQWPKEPSWPKFQGTFVSQFRNLQEVLQEIYLFMTCASAAGKNNVETGGAERKSAYKTGFHSTTKQSRRAMRWETSERVKLKCKRKIINLRHERVSGLVKFGCVLNELWVQACVKRTGGTGASVMACRRLFFDSLKESQNKEFWVGCQSPRQPNGN